jgi:hypothetical protein
MKVYTSNMLMSGGFIKNTKLNWYKQTVSKTSIIILPMLFMKVNVTLFSHNGNNLDATRKIVYHSTIHFM